MIPSVVVHQRNEAACTHEELTCNKFLNILLKFGVGIAIDYVNLETEGGFKSFHYWRRGQLVVTNQ